MKLTQNKIFFGILIFKEITAFLCLIEGDCFYLRTILSFIFLITIPGLLIMLMLKIRKINPWESLVYTIGLSLAFLIFAGLLVNWTLPLLGVSQPLSLLPLLASFDLWLLVFWLIAYKRNKRISVEIKLEWKNKFFLIMPVFFSLLSILGATVLNHHGPNYLTMAMLGGIAAYVFLVVLFRENINENIFPLSLVFIALSLLLMISLRSDYLIGWDINREYQGFRLTDQLGHWSMADDPGNPYYAMLSITLLPTILSSFIKLNSLYVFKVLFQIIASFIALVVYLFLSKHTSKVVAFLGAFFLLAQPEFAAELPALARQEIALFFFGLILLAVFSRELKAREKGILSTLFAAGMTVSHYTTTYVALFLLVSAYALVSFYDYSRRKELFSHLYTKLNLENNKKGFNQPKRKISLSLILIIMVFSFCWYWPVTSSTGQFMIVAEKVFGNLDKIFDRDLRSEPARRAIWDIGYVSRYTDEEVQRYVIAANRKYRTWLQENEFYADEFQLKQVESPLIPVVSKTAFLSERILHELAKKSLKVFIFIGLLFLLFFEFKKGRIDQQFIVLAFGCFALIAALIFLPYLSVYYNLSRLYIQSLFILSFPLVLGANLIFTKILKKSGVLPTTVLILIYFLPYSGFTTQIVGGLPVVHLNNFGSDFEDYYVYQSEISSISWLSTQVGENEVVFADSHATLHLKAFSHSYKQPYLEDVFPTTIFKDAYVYASHKNTVKRVGTVNGMPILNKNILRYEFPTESLNINKDKIYTNGESEIFR